MYHQSSPSGRTPLGVHVAVIVSHPPVTLGDIFADQVAERFAQGEALFWQGDAAAHVFEVVSGALRTVHVMSDGRRVITGFLFPGDVVGVSLRNRYLTTVEAIAPTQVRRLGRHRFEAAVDRYPDLRDQRIERLGDEMTAAQEQVVLLARKTAEERVASFLRSLARRNGGTLRPGQQIPLPMTRLDMADYLGLTIETVSRVMTRLTARGIIGPAGRHEIAIQRPAALAAIAMDEADEDDVQVVARAS
jgi:CRP/FNR family transcriptional regulator